MADKYMTLNERLEDMEKRIKAVEAIAMDKAEFARMVLEAIMGFSGVKTRQDDD